MRSLFNDRPTWVAGLAFGIASASVDLHSFNAVAIHRLAICVRGDPSVLAAKMGVALDFSPRIVFAYNRTHYEQLGGILGRSLRRVLWAGSLHAGHAGWAGAAKDLKLVPGQASRSLKKQSARLGKEQMHGRSVNW